MTTDRSTLARRLPALLGALALALAVSACGMGTSSSHPTAVTAAELNAGAEPYVFAGPLTYQVQISRQLNPFATEDSTYLQASCRRRADARARSALVRRVPVG